MEYYSLTKKEALEEAGSSEAGLDMKEAAKRLRSHGPNELKKVKKRSALLKFLDQFKNFLIIILIAATIVSLAIGEVIDAIVIIVIVLLNALLGFIQEYRAEKSLEALKRMVSPHAVVIRGGKQMRIPASEVVPGDILILEAGDKVPADARIIESLNLKIDEAALTGESVAVDKTVECIKKSVPLADCNNMAFAGTVVVFGRGRALVTATGMKTELGKIAELVQETETESTPLQRRLEHFGKQLGIGIMVLCTVIFLMGIIRNPSPDNMSFMFLAAVSLAVAAIPEGLPAVVTMALAIGTQRMAGRNAIIRKLPAVETLGSCDVICSDKTGTLTKNEMTVKRIYVDGVDIEVSGSGYESEGDFIATGNSQVPKDGLEMILKNGVLCNNASIDGGQVGDPTELALLVAGQKRGLNKGTLETKSMRLYEIPFDSERKRMSTINRGDGKTVLHTKGGVEIVLGLCDRYYKDGKTSRLDKAERMRILKKNEELAKSGLRVLGFAYRKISGAEKFDDAEKDLVFIGLMGMIDPPREESLEAIRVSEEAGISVKMITGDHKLTAEAIAVELGIMRAGQHAMTGEELNKLSDSELTKIVEDISVFARVNPEHKLRIVDALKRNGHTVAMTGDGVNDAPALKKADIGVAMGITGTEVTKEAGAMILTDDNFATIVNAIEEGRVIYENIRKFVLFLISSNAGEVLTMFIGIMIGWPLPLIAVQILWVNLVTDGLPALALGVDPPEKALMKRGPRSPKEGIFSKLMMRNVILVGAIIALGTLWVFADEMNGDLTDGAPGIERARTMAFTTLMMFQMVNVLNCRSIKESLFRAGFFKNRKLWLAIGISVALQATVLYVPFLSDAFGTVALGAMDWAKVILVSLSVFVVVEVWKFIERRR